jgi:LPXTG-site transpeptidase (sortase) family protein
MLKSIRGGFISLIFLFIFLTYSNIFVDVKFIYYDEAIPLFSVVDVDNVDDSFSSLDEAIGSIVIDKINLDRKLYSFDSDLNNVNKNVTIISPSDMPDVIGGTLILAAHSGNVNSAYFKRLNELSIGDVVNIYYSDVKYVYKISSFYEEKRNSSIVIKREKMKNVLVLTTCKIGTKKQLVYVANLVNKCNVDGNC